MIVIVAPYSPPGSCEIVHLGASRKLEVVINSLSRLSSKVVLINSAHNSKVPAKITVREINISNVSVVEVIPPIFRNRTLGKFLNLFSINSIIDILSGIGLPKLFWFYNGYAFEMAIARKLKNRFSVPMIIEVEDWHFSRGRGLNPKPFIDFFFWIFSIRLMSGAFVVNADIQQKVKRYVSDVKLLPGIVPDALFNIRQKSRPFGLTNGRVNIGFFGGLNIEKGADIVLGLVGLLPKNYVIHVTGSGDLESEFKECATRFPDLIVYHGQVNDAGLYNIIESSDIILNPHSSILHMSNGVFPFKVIEAIASGKLLISTNVPHVGLEDLLVGIKFVEPSVSDFVSAICNGHKYFLENEKSIFNSSLIAYQRFGVAALLKDVNAMVNR